ncbi:THUMP domain-containing protein 2 [Bagarius yarrelli]|uniref:THUMP domain-containing protein 2 n=1 Tax=Bagarius yarrelli TaxID=175774 RepID=A0A556V2W9_BAGYA|nr:THUMP domain-containing protein 2 [Bagarius yarrelli]
MMRDGDVSVQFYCTTGAGMETFLLEEVKRKLNAKEVEHIPGRVFFRCDSNLPELMRLKSAERLFLLLRKAPPTSLPTNAAKAASVIQQRIVGNPDDWSGTLSTWSLLQAELRHSGGRSQKRKRDEEGETSNRPTFRNKKQGRVSADVPVRFLLLSLQLSALIKKLVHSEDRDTHASETDAGRREMKKKQSAFDSLLLQSKHRVSLGSTDALIHTYTKRHTPPESKQ